MNRPVKLVLLFVATISLLLGMASVLNSKDYTELTNLEQIEGTLRRIHCPQKGAAALNIDGSEETFNLSIKFRTTYCDDNNANILLGKPLSIEALRVNEGFYQVYKLTHQNDVIVEPIEVEADRSNSVIGLFLISFILFALVAYKSLKQRETNEPS